jgi:hypothetical protein
MLQVRPVTQSKLTKMRLSKTAVFPAELHGGPPATVHWSVTVTALLLAEMFW